MKTILAGAALAAVLALGGCVSMGHDMAAMHGAGGQHDCASMCREHHQDGEECSCCQHEAGAAAEAGQASHCDHCEEHGEGAGQSHSH